MRRHGAGAGKPKVLPMGESGTPSGGAPRPWAAVAVATAVVAIGLNQGAGVAAPDLELQAARGYAAVAPENTLAAVRAAKDAGVTVSWVDVRTTADGVPVLLADETLDRTTDCTGPVAAVTAAAVAACDAGSWFDASFAGEGVPTVAEAMAVPGVSLVLDLRAADPAAVAAAVVAAGAAGRVAVSAGDAAGVAAVEAAVPEIVTWLHVALLDVRAIAAATQAGADGIAAPARNMSGGPAASARRAGLSVAALVPGGEGRLYDMVAMGVNVVATPRLKAAQWALGVTYRTYGGPEFGRANEPGSDFPAALAVGDFNNDGRADLALGAPADTSGGRDAGWLGVTFGGDAFPNQVYSDAGDEAAGQWGSVLAVGDFNADGFDDLAVGVPRRDFSGQDSGTVWLLDGAAGGIGALARPVRDIGEASALDGAALAVGDFNGDAVDDIAVGSPGIGRAGQGAAGQVTLMPGRAGSGPVSDGSLVVDRSVDGVPGLPSTNEMLGSALAAGDFNGDGYDDVAIGVPGADAGDVRDAGAVLIALSAVDEETGAIVASEVREVAADSRGLPGPAERNGAFGASLAAADFDGDGKDDLVIGAPAATVSGRRGAGKVIVLYGDEAGPGGSRVEAISADSGLVPGVADAGDGFGRVLTVGDLDADGFPDLLVGLPEKNVGALLDAGQVVALFGTPFGLSSRRSLEIVAGMFPIGAPAENRQELGRSVAVADLNGDDVPDVAIGAVGQQHDGAAAAGALVVAWGPSVDLPGVPTATSRPPTVTPTATITPTPRPTRTPLPRHYAYVPYAARVALLGRYPPTPGPAAAALAPERAK